MSRPPCGPPDPVPNVAQPGVSGSVDPAFARVADLFSNLVSAGSERGALAVAIDGHVVVDIHGGAADPLSGRPWRKDTLACCFSVTKGVFSLLAHLLIDRGSLDPDRRVADLWPEFAAGGKGDITIADVMTHRAGLPAVSQACARGDLYNWETMTGLLAASRSVVEPRAAPVYHNMTYGYLLGEIMRRATGRPVRDLLADLLCQPLGVDFAIGLSAADQARIASLTQDDPDSLFRRLEAEPDTLFSRSMAFFDESEDFNTERWRGAVIGAGSGHATAPALARLYGQLVNSRSFLSAARQADARTERCRSAGVDPVLGLPIRHALGFELSLPPSLDFGPNPATTGYWGAGGATAFADPDSRLAFGYVTGAMAPGLGSSDRARALVAVAYDCM